MLCYTGTIVMHEYIFLPIITFLFFFPLISLLFPTYFQMYYCIQQAEAGGYYSVPRGADEKPDQAKNNKASGVQATVKAHYLLEASTAAPLTPDTHPYKMFLAFFHQHVWGLQGSQQRMLQQRPQKIKRTT